MERESSSAPRRDRLRDWRDMPALAANFAVVNYEINRRHAAALLLLALAPSASLGFAACQGARGHRALAVWAQPWGRGCS